MDFLNKLFAQLTDLFKSMSPGARLTAALLLVAVVVSLGYLFNSQASGADTFLLNGQSFTSEEMQAMEAAFGKAGLSDYTADGSRIRIVKSRQAAYLAALADNGALPSQFGDHFSKALASAGPFTPRATQEEMIKSARQRELAMVIRSMNGIENAVVHYDIQKRTGGLSNNQIITASVSVKPRGNLQLDEARVPMIRSLVASAIAGLSPENVTIVDINGRAYGGPKSGGAGSAHTDPYLSMTRAYKEMIETDIRDALAYVPGATATANVELDRDIRKTVDETKVDPKTVPISINTTENSTTSNMSSGGPGGRPGLPSQQPNAPASLPGGGGGGSNNEETRSTNQQNNVASHSNSKTELAGLTPKRVAVAVGIPSDYFEQVWQLQNPPAAGGEKKKPDAAALATIEAAEIKRIKEHVTQLIPKPVDPAQPIDPATLVTVTAFSRLAPPELDGPSMVDRSLDWLAGSWSTLGMIGLGLFSLLMLKSFVGSVAVASPAPEVRSATISEEEDEEPATAKGAAASADKDPTKSKQRTLHRRLGTGMSLREELIDMVREDPEAAANVLRSWIGNAT